MLKKIVFLVAAILMAGPLILVAQEKFLICHFSQSAGTYETIEVSAQGRDNHLNNHPADTDGECPSPS